VQGSPSFSDDRLLTVGEVAGAMRVSTMTVYRLIKAGDLGDPDGRRTHVDPDPGLGHQAPSTCTDRSER
jgi:excisionase family DNA binding protein